MPGFLQNGALDVRAFIDARPISAFQWRVVALCFLIVALDGFDMSVIGFVAPALRAEWAVAPAALWPVMVAALVGLALGAFASGPLADRVGRRRVLLSSVLVFALFSLLTAFANDITTLAVLRLLAGLGLGAAMPNAVTLTAEFCPQRARSVMVTTMFCGFTLGSALGGLVAAQMLPAWGWRPVLLLGGLAPMLVLPLMALWLPESVRFVLMRDPASPRAKGLLARIGPLPAQWNGRYVVEPAPPGAPLRQIFSPQLRLGTCLLWGTFCMSLLIIYLLTNWLPMLITRMGQGPERAAGLGAMFQLGGTAGAIVLGAAMDRFGGHRVLAASYLCGALATAAISLGVGSAAALGTLVALVGFCISGSQVGANVLAAGFYPTASRATGVAWALGAGRLGSIAGSLAGGGLLGLGWGIHAIFGLLVIPAVLASAMVGLKGWCYRQRPSVQAAAERAPVH